MTPMIRSRNIPLRVMGLAEEKMAVKLLKFQPVQSQEAQVKLLIWTLRLIRKTSIGKSSVAFQK